MIRLYMKKKTGLVVLLMIVVSAFSACSKNNTQSSAEEGAQTQAAAAEGVQTRTAADSYAKILNGDLSAFAGTWVNGIGVSARLMSNGAFVWGLDLPESGLTPGSRFSSDTNEAGEVYYYWGIIEENEDGESYGFGMFLYPVGVDIIMFDTLVRSDKTKTRILAGLFIYEAPQSPEVFYLEGETQSIIMYVNSEDGLRIRAEPSTESGIVKSLQHGQRVVLAERGASATIDGITSYWYKISGEAGWIFGGYLSNFPLVNPAINEYKFNDVSSLFEFIVSYEKLDKQQIKDYSSLLANRIVLEEDNRFLTISSKNINFVVIKYEDLYEIYDVIINKNSDYMNMFPYKHIDEYLSDRHFGNIQSRNHDQIFYSLSYYPTDSWIWEFGVALNFNTDGVLDNVKIGFPR